MDNLAICTVKYLYIFITCCYNTDKFLETFINDLDMYEDVYGHSVEEHDLCVSPTTGESKLERL